VFKQGADLGSEIERAERGEIGGHQHRENENEPRISRSRAGPLPPCPALAQGRPCLLRAHAVDAPSATRGKLCPCVVNKGESCRRLGYSVRALYTRSAWPLARILRHI